MQHKHPSCTVIGTKIQIIGGNLEHNYLVLKIWKASVHVQSAYTNLEEKAQQNGYRTCWLYGS